MTSATAITYHQRMGRWEPGALGRLQQAAMELYVERGFEQTTVAEIAARAGLTERTFFRHFADKREVLFAGSESLTSLLAEAVGAAPATASPMDAVTAGLEAFAGVLADRHDHARRRQALINANPVLHERELIKLASLTTVMANGLRQRGVPAAAASLTAETGMAVFRVAFARWIDQTGTATLSALIHESLEDLKTLTR
jgi:AcrR family transcriptional regulator